MKFCQLKKSVSYAQDKLYHLVVALFVNATILTDFVRYFATAIWEPVRVLATPLRNVLYVGCFLYVVYLVFRYGFDWIDLTVIAVSVVAWGGSYLLNPAISNFWLEPVLEFFSRVCVGFILFRHMENYEKLAGIMVWFFPLIIFYGILGFFQVSHIYMTLSYNIMPQALFFLFWGLSQKKIRLEIMGMTLFFLASFLGCRGALLGGFVAIVLCLVSILICGQRKDFFRALIHIVVGAAVMMLIHWLLTIDYSQFKMPQWIGETTNELLSKSRNTQLAQKGNMDADSNRFRIYGRVIAAIREKPILPNGLLADRFVVPLTSTPAAKHYAHNIVLEIVYQWGIPLGLCLIGGIVFLFFKKASKVRKMDKSQLAFMLTFVPMTAVQLMVSYSYLISWLFGITMGLLASKVIEINPVKEADAALAEHSDEESAAEERQENETLPAEEKE